MDTMMGVLVRFVYQFYGIAVECYGDNYIRAAVPNDVSCVMLDILSRGGDTWHPLPWSPLPGKSWGGGREGGRGGPDTAVVGVLVPRRSTFQ